MNSPAFPRRHRAQRGIALIVTLALVVLMTIAIVAFLASVLSQQVSTSSEAGGNRADVLSHGATASIIAGLQNEMYVGSGNVSGIFPMVNNQVITPSRAVRSASTGDGISGLIPVAFPGASLFTGSAPNPAFINDPYFQYGNLVKQSLYNVPQYTLTTPAAAGLKIASQIPTTKPSIDGRLHDGTFWRLPQLIVSPSPLPGSTADPLIPDWIYVARDGSNPVTFAGSPAQSTIGTAPNGKFITGRYAYNIYDIGGLLNANVVGYNTGTGSNPGPVLQPSPTSVDQLLVPGYKGSELAADLTALTMGGAITSNGTTVSMSNSSWPAYLPLWRASGKWPTTTSGSLGYGYLISGGEFSGWLSDLFAPFDVNGLTATSLSGASPLTNYRFTSRQDLINWVRSYWSASAQSNQNMSWTLPYLTHFSFDTDAPSYSPDVNRPAVQPGGNDAAGTDNNIINPSLTSTETASNPPVDSAGNPLIKRRFPLSALALIANNNPANPGPVPASSLGQQIQYDFGLVWTSYTDPNTGEASPCWQYKDMEGGTSVIKKLKDVAAIVPTRSPNFFELLKAAIATGSLGQQYGSTYCNLPPTGSGLGGFGYLNGRDASTNAHILQIGANIIAQTSTNYTPCHINFNGTTDVYGDQDLPRIYKENLLPYAVDRFTGKNMMITGLGNSWLEVVGLEAEVWNAHAPNAIGGVSISSYPTAFRVAPRTTTATYCESGSVGGTWANGGTLSSTTGTPSYTDDFVSPGGLDCSTATNYSASTGVAAAINFTAVTPSTSLTAPLNSFREPCPLIAANVPPGISSSGPSTMKITGFTPSNAAAGAGQLDLSNSSAAFAGGVNPIPTVFTASGSPPTKAYAVQIGYICQGPKTPSPPPPASTNGQWISIQECFGGPLSESLQYSPDGGSHYYTYDLMDSAYPTAVPMQAEGVGNGQTQPQVGVRADPRTSRWGLIWDVDPASGNTLSNFTKNQYPGQTMMPAGDLGYNMGALSNYPSNTNFWHGWTALFPFGQLQTNAPPKPTSSPYIQMLGSGGTTDANYYSYYYQDPDGVTRLADGAYTNQSDSAGNGGGGYGLPMKMMTTALSGSNVKASSFTFPVGYTNYNSRPVILNRPFLSVGELGYVFRDVPWKSLDFFTPLSGDAALLDYFCTYGPDPWTYADANPNHTTTFLNAGGLVVGRVNLNTVQPPVLASLLSGTAVTTPTSNSALTTSGASPTEIPPAVAGNIAEALTAWTHSNSNLMGPLRNRAELVGKYVSGTVTTGSSPTNTLIYSGFSFGDPNTPANQLTSLLLPLGNEAAEIKQQRECVVRALADVGTTRTWNLLIDLVAQSGQVVPGATSLDTFAVSGERHVWVSVAIDRMTGKVIQMQVEPVRL